MDQLHKQWHQAGNYIIGATDGGLKDQVGTSSYGIFLPNEDTAVVAGYAAEFQPRKSASSTRQELLGQLGLEYWHWLEKLSFQWGVPRNVVQIALVTNSQASIEIMDKVIEMKSIKDLLALEMDIALELASQQQKKFWLTWKVVKVESHIERGKAPDEFLWHCNCDVDSLAIKARDVYPLHKIQREYNRVLPCAILGCQIQGRLEHNNLYSILKETIYGQALQKYLVEKYDWTHTVFNGIAWEVHAKELKKTRTQRKVTVIKYIHGWLENSTRRHFTGRALDNLCPLCGQAENRRHFFCCQQEQMKQLREMRIKTLIDQLGKQVDKGCHQVFCSGVRTVLVPTIQTNQQSWIGRQS